MISWKLCLSIYCKFWILPFLVLTFLKTFGIRNNFFILCLHGHFVVLFNCLHNLPAYFSLQMFLTFTKTTVCRLVLLRIKIIYVKSGIYGSLVCKLENLFNPIYFPSEFLHDQKLLIYATLFFYCSSFKSRCPLHGLQNIDILDHKMILWYFGSRLFVSV